MYFQVSQQIQAVLHEAPLRTACWDGIRLFLAHRIFRNSDCAADITGTAITCRLRYD